MSVRHDHHTRIFVVCAPDGEGAPNVVAVGGEHSVEVLQVVRLYSVLEPDFVLTALQDGHLARPIASFHIGSHITALGWSSRAVSPTVGEDWFLE
jgi:hypothetical protein